MNFEKSQKLPQILGNFYLNIYLRKDEANEKTNFSDSLVRNFLTPLYQEGMVSLEIHGTDRV